MILISIYNDEHDGGFRKLINSRLCSNTLRL